MNNYNGYNSRRIFDVAVMDGMPELLARFMVGQSKFETGDYKNDHCKLHNAFFSYMLDPHSRWQVPGGGPIADNGAPVAKYATIDDSVHEMTSWIKRRQKDGKFPKNLNEIDTAEKYAYLLQTCGFYQGWKRIKVPKKGGGFDWKYLTAADNLELYTKGIEKGMADLT